MLYVIFGLVLGFAVCCVLIPFNKKPTVLVYCALGFGVASSLLMYGRLL